MGKDLKGKELGRGLSQRKDGRYEARAVINGVKIDIYGASLAKLRREFDAQKAIVLRNEKNIRPNVTLSEWYEEWFEKCKSPQLKNDVSRKRYYKRVVNTFLPIIGDKKLEDIAQINIQSACHDLSNRDYTDRTIRESLGILRECLDSAVYNSIISRNPCVGIKIRNSIAQKERSVLSKWEQKAFLDEARDSYYYEAYCFLLLTGVRIGEFAGLQWNDIDFEKKIININRSMSTNYINGAKQEFLTTPKTQNSYRQIPFFGDIEQILVSWRNKQDSYKAKLGAEWRADESLGDLVFTSRTGSPVTRYVIIHDLKRIEDNLALKEELQARHEGRPPRPFSHIHPHAFRHTFATRCFERGLEPIFIQRIMGHSSYTTTVSYTHVLEDVFDRERIKAGNLLESA